MSDDLKTNYTKLNKKYQEMKKELAVYKKAVEKIKEQFNYEVKNNFIVSVNCVNYINMYIPDVENFLDNVLDEVREELKEK